jgi:hypothetical protein
MTIEAVIAYWEHASPSEDEDDEAIVARASRSGFVFTAAELRTAFQVRELLRTVQQDKALRDQLRSAQAPMNALMTIGRQCGYDVDRDAVLAVFRASHMRQGELGAETLDQVTGGTYVLPQIDDEVLVAFLNGDTRAPYIVGSLWNGGDKPPTGR